MRKFVSLALVVAMLLTLAIPALATADPVPGNPSPKMDWNPAYVAKALTLTPYDYDRGNASGDKIPSNAHSADFPGIYFYWNDKQRDDGVLLVDPMVFSLFVDNEFTVTAKTSNCYWGHLISKDEGAYNAASGLYIFNVFKNCMYKDKKGNVLKDDMKNINMIFIDGTYKCAKFIITKDWYDVKGNKITDQSIIDELNLLLSFNGGLYNLGMNFVSITDYKSAYYGKTIIVTEGPIDGYFPVPGTKTSHVLKVKWNDKPIQKADFHNQKIKITPEFGVKVKKFVDGKPYMEWYGDNLLLAEELYRLISFDIYAADGATGPYSGPSLGTGVLLTNGQISFGDTFTVPAGWYAIVETLTGIALDMFEIPEPLYIYVGATSSGETDVINSLFMISGINGNVGEVVTNNDTDGTPLQEAWTNNLANPGLYAELADIAQLYDVELAWVWKDAIADNNNFHGQTWTIERDFYIGDKIVTDEAGQVPIYFGADDAVVVWINGELAAYSTHQLAIDNGNFVWDYPFGAYQGDKEGFRIYYEDVFDKLIPNATNTIKIDVMNQPSRAQGGEGEINGNPSGLLLFFEVAYKDIIFNNYTVEPPVFDLEVEKFVDDFSLGAWINENNLNKALITSMLKFELYKVDAEGDPISGTPIASGFLDADGKILFEGLEAGWYAVVETLVNGGETVFFLPEVLYVLIDKNGDSTVYATFFNSPIPKTPEYEYPNIDKIPSDSHIARWFNAYGIYCLAGNTTYDGNKYFIVLDEIKFNFNKYAEVTVRYGSNITDASNQKTFSTTGPISEITYNGVTYRGVIYEFNVFGSGAMHAYLYSLLLK